MNGRAMATEIAQIEGYLKTFTDFATENAKGTPRWFSELRDAGFARFCETGFPTIRDEDWRFTNLSAVARTPFVLAGESTHPVRAADLDKWRIDGAAQMVF